MAVRPASVKSINRASKTVELDDGRTLPLPDDLAFEFFGSKAAKQKKEHMAQSVQDLQSAVSNVPGGQSAGAFASGFGESSIFPRLANNFLDYAGQSIASIRKGEGQENLGFFERLGENVGALRAGRREGHARIAAENPGASQAGALSGLAADILTPIKGLPRGPVAQGATLGALFSAGSDKNVLQDPLGVAKEIGTGAGLGAGIGAIGSRLANVARQRGALRAHPGEVAQHTQRTAQAEKQFLDKMNRGLDTVQREIKGAGIPKEALAIDEFVNRNIGLSPMAATQEGKGISAFLKAVEDAAPNSLNAGELKSIFSAVEGRLAASASPAEQGVLNAFRQHLVDRLPQGAANAAAKYKYGTRLLNAFEKEVDTGVNSFLSDKKMVQDLKKFVGNAPVDNLAGDIKRFVKTGYDKIAPSEFINDLNSGNFKDRLLWFFDNNQKVKELTQKVESTLSNLQNVAPIAQLRSPEIQNLVKARDALQAMRANIETNITRRIAQNVNPASAYTADVAKNVGTKISDAVGLRARPTAATNLRPAATPPPPAPQVGRTAQFLETPNFYRTQVGNLFNVRGKTGLAKVAALAAGGAKLKIGAGVAAGAGGLTAALRGATSPTALGAFARAGIQRGGIRMVVESIASTYPSYENGVLTDPEDRRMAAAQIEQDQDLSLEDKAILQTKINRGVNLETLIRDEDYDYGN